MKSESSVRQRKGTKRQEVEVKGICYFPRLSLFASQVSFISCLRTHRFLLKASILLSNFEKSEQVLNMKEQPTFHSIH
jgi:hypothetical protein